MHPNGESAKKCPGLKAITMLIQFPVDFETTN